MALLPAAPGGRPGRRRGDRCGPRPAGRRRAVRRRSRPRRQHASGRRSTAYALGARRGLVVLAGQLGNSAPGGLGVTALLLPLGYGVVHVAVLAVGELTWPRPQGEVRRARLVRRGLLDAAPAWLVRAAGAALALAVAVLVGRRAAGRRQGRRFAASASDGRLLGVASPFPGLFYGGPAAIGLLVLAVATAGALWIVATRPAVATADERIERRCAGPPRTGCCGRPPASTSFVAGGLLFVGGNAMHSVGTGPAGTAARGSAASPTALLGLAGAAGRRRPELHPGARRPGRHARRPGHRAIHDAGHHRRRQPARRRPTSRSAAQIAAHVRGGLLARRRPAAHHAGARRRPGRRRRDGGARLHRAGGRRAGREPAAHRHRRHRRPGPRGPGRRAAAGHRGAAGPARRARRGVDGETVLAIVRAALTVA